MVDHKYEHQKAFQELQLSKTFSYENFMTTSPASLLSAVPAAFPANESERIQKLLSYSILDTASETIYDDITEVAAYICGTATSLVSLVDVSRQWFKSTVGQQFQIPDYGHSKPLIYRSLLIMVKLD